MNNILVIDDEIDGNANNDIKYRRSAIESNYKFKPVDLWTLNDIFTGNPSDIFNYDTSECLTVIIDSGDELSLHEYADQHVRFVKISTPELFESDNEILISCLVNGHQSYTNQWSSRCTLFNEDIPDYRAAENYKYALESDLNGYQNTVSLMKKHKTSNELKYINTDLCAIADCMDTVEYVNGILYTGYLPSMGQMRILANCEKLVNHVMKRIHFWPLDIYGNTWWTSTEFDKDYAAFLCCGSLTAYAYKTNKYKALTFFHKNDTLIKNK